ncbi:hypothetical protein L2E82_29460 [Cichorium intybus]|uniref:Uncharacterized protein n=1 Tax=Cichorium intybus TaxID=13427 RepID=A0ACB9CY13_CICIN|nr:hypothetical protein L2E82_29460 [Cichorium intybus]
MAGDTPGRILCSNPPLDVVNVQPVQVFSAQPMLDSEISIRNYDEHIKSSNSFKDGEDLQEKRNQYRSRGYKISCPKNSSADSADKRRFQDKNVILRKKRIAKIVDGKQGEEQTENDLGKEIDRFLQALKILEFPFR